MKKVTCLVNSVRQFLISPFSLSLIFFPLILMAHDPHSDLRRYTSTMKSNDHEHGTFVEHRSQPTGILSI